MKLIIVSCLIASLAGCASAGLNREERVAIVGADSACDHVPRGDKSDPSSPCFVARGNPGK